MKHNLKTFPKMIDSNGISWFDPLDIQEWLKGFEEELRQLRQKYYDLLRFGENSLVRAEALGRYRLINMILGEASE